MREVEGVPSLELIDVQRATAATNSLVCVIDDEGRVRVLDAVPYFVATSTNGALRTETPVVLFQLGPPLRGVWK